MFRSLIRLLKRDDCCTRWTTEYQIFFEVYDVLACRNKSPYSIDIRDIVHHFTYSPILKL